jgi:hypothetical protein
VARRGILPVRVLANKAGRAAATATTDRATSRRIGVGRRSTRVGRGTRTASANRRTTLNIRLTRKARTALRRQKRRTLRITARVTFAPADGTAAVTRRLSVFLRP